MSMTEDELKLWHEESDDYVRLCKKYNVPVKDEVDFETRGWPYDWRHHTELQTRERKEGEA